MQKEPISLVVFGATGDLMARKILPSLFYLFREKKLSKGFRVVGISRRDISKEGFREKMREAAGKFDEIAKDKKFVGFLKLFYFGLNALHRPLYFDGFRSQRIECQLNQQCQGNYGYTKISSW